MTYFTDGVRYLIEKNEVTQARDKLLTVLKNGRKDLHEQVIRMSPTKSLAPRKRGNGSPRATKNQSPQSLEKFLSKLEKDEPIMVSFLSHIESAEQQLAIGAWGEAEKYLTLAAEIHQESFNLSKEEIQSRIHFCQNTQSFNQHVDTANKYFISKTWKAALSSYNQALDLVGQDFDSRTIDAQIDICKKAIRCDEYLALAKLAKSEKKWGEASEYYQKAFQLDITEHYPAIIKLNLEEEIRKCKKKEQKQPLRLGHTPASSSIFNMNKSGTTLLLFVGIIAFLALYLYYPALTQLVDKELIAQSTPEENEIPSFVETAAVDERLNEQDMATSFAVEDNSAIDTSLIGNLPLSDSIAEPDLIAEIPKDVPVEKEEFTLKETPNLGLSAEINTAPTPNQIRQLLKPKSVSKQRPIEEEIEEIAGPMYEAGRIAILPFCHEEEDASLAKRIYMDATFAIRTSGKSSQSAVSKNLVQGVIQKLDIGNKNLCDELQAKIIARQLKAESILIGTISHLPNEQVRIICEVLHVPSLRYSGEIVITDSNSARLRSKLKREIQQVFQ